MPHRRIGKSQRYLPMMYKQINLKPTFLNRESQSKIIPQTKLHDTILASMVDHPRLQNLDDVENAKVVCEMIVANVLLVQINLALVVVEPKRRPA